MKTKSKTLKHISIIMDGNGRWANKRNRPRAFGHQAGVKAISEIVRACKYRQISELTLFAFSSENWKRPRFEVDFLMRLFKKSIDEYVNDLHENNIRIEFIGDYRGFSKILLKRISDATELTKSNTGMKLNLAINYGGRWDLINAFKEFCSSQEFKVDKDMITQENIEKYLSINTLDPDLLICQSTH